MNRGLSRSSFHGFVFTVAVTAASRTLILRDRLLGRVKPVRIDEGSGGRASRHVIASNGQILDAVFVRPEIETLRASLLICHGIGETVDHWFSVQNLLAAHGVASLVFDYAGYGRSSGIVHWKQCEDDAIAAFELLRSLTPAMRLCLLGFSMGSGIAASVLDRITPTHLILCAAFTSFRAAACVLGLPKWLAFAAPPIWNSQEHLRRCPAPVLIMHGGQDRVFPERMAQELASACDPPAELVVVPSQRHNEPFYRPQLLYWDAVIRVVTQRPG